jgi:DNA-binding transcriptional LysR family regulator
MGPQIGEALRKLEAALRLDTFDPLKATNAFRLAVSDHAAIVFLPQLLAHVHRVAPEVLLRVEPKSNSEIEGKLDRGEIDLAIGVIPPMAKRFKRINLFEDSYVLLMRTDHPLAGRNLKMSDVAGAGHLAVRPAYSTESGIDFLFRRAGLERRIQLSTTQFLAIPGILRSSNLLASMFRRMTDQIDRSGIVVRNVPLSNTAVRVAALWPRDFDGDVAHNWLRSQLKIVADGLGPVATKT